MDNTYYIGNFSEKNFDFFESIHHYQSPDYYNELPFSIKFGGLRSNTFGSAENKGYSWLRNPKNLKVAFNAFSIIGLDKFISKEKYFKKNDNWCCDTDWENMSLNEVVMRFVNSDTSSESNDYYSKFWQRRRLENNLLETYNIFGQINKFYNENDSSILFEPSDSILIAFLNHDTKLINSDSTQYLDNAIDYFGFLKSVGLDYSAYKLIFNNSRLNLDKYLRDSLIMTMKYDTLSVDNWENLNDNRNGWISGDYYPDPNRYYGP